MSDMDLTRYEPAEDVPMLLYAAEDGKTYLAPHGAKDILPWATPGDKWTKVPKVQP